MISSFQCSKRKKKLKDSYHVHRRTSTLKDFSPRISQVPSRWMHGESNHVETNSFFLEGRMQNIINVDKITLLKNHSEESRPSKVHSV